MRAPGSARGRRSSLAGYTSGRKSFLKRQARSRACGKRKEFRLSLATPPRHPTYGSKARKAKQTTARSHGMVLRCVEYIAKQHHSQELINRPFRYRFLYFLRCHAPQSLNCPKPKWRHLCFGRNGKPPCGQWRMKAFAASNHRSLPPGVA